MADNNKPSAAKTVEKAGPTVKQPMPSDNTPIKRNANVDVPERTLPRSTSPGS
jgi:hypothetical protein